LTAETKTSARAAVQAASTDDPDPFVRDIATIARRRL
jgi:hypothetical protein